MDIENKDILDDGKERGLEPLVSIPYLEAKKKG